MEGSIHQALAVTSARHARYRGIAKTHLEHVFTAVALNLIRLDAHCSGRASDRTRSSQLGRRPACGERSVVRDGDLSCALCGSALPTRWNFGSN